MMVFAIVFAWNENLSSCNKGKNAGKKVSDSRDSINLSPEEVKWVEGKDLFKTNCSACHNPKANGVGPALKGVTARWEAAGSYQGKTGEQWLKIWIHNW